MDIFDFKRWSERDLTDCINSPHQSDFIKSSAIYEMLSRRQQDLDDLNAVLND